MLTAAITLNVFAAVLNLFFFMTTGNMVNGMCAAISSSLAIFLWLTR